MMTLSPTNLTLLVAGIPICIQIWLYWPKVRKVPPGFRRVPSPKGLPLIGNSLQLGKHPRKQFEKWTKEYGELFKIQLGWNNWVFLNSREAVKEMLDRQWASTSSRMPLPVSSDLASGGYRFLMMGYTPTWRKLRAIVHKLLTPKASDMFKPSQDFEAKQLVDDILTDNTTEEEFYMYIRRYTTSVVMTSIYGKRVPNWVRLWPVIVSCHLS
jgi:cytochrome P450